MNWRERVSVDPRIHHGKPCIKGARVPVSVIVGSIADGDTRERIIESWPQLSSEDIEAALEFVERDEFWKLRVFEPVATRVIQQADSLVNLARFPRSGIEGWFKVEAVKALGSAVKKLQNKGPDLLLCDNLLVELKAATDCNPSWILNGLKYRNDQCYRHYQLLCLFMGDGRNISYCMEVLGHEARVIAYKRFPVAEDDWIVGLIESA